MIITDMKKRFGLSLFLVLSLSCQALSSPVVNINDPVVWSSNGFSMKRDIGVVVTFDFDLQKNYFLSQRSRFGFNKEGDGFDLKRHVEKRRASKLDLTYQGLKLGAVLKEKYFLYTVLGTSNSELAFHFNDQTVNHVVTDDTITDDTFTTDVNFTSNGDIVFGGGISCILYEPRFETVKLFKVGLDAQYRHFSIDSNDPSDRTITYSSTLDEIQLALIVSRKIKSVYPYFGVRISRVTGDELYSNLSAKGDYNNEVIYDGYINPPENCGFIMGCNFNVFDIMSLGVESRFGNEEAYGLNASFRY